MPHNQDECGGICQESLVEQDTTITLKNYNFMATLTAPDLKERIQFRKTYYHTWKLIAGERLFHQKNKWKMNI